MAKVRIGFSTQFELENELVGIGTDNPTNTLQALGNIHATNTKAIGVSTFAAFDGLQILKQQYLDLKVLNRVHYLVRLLLKEK